MITLIATQFKNKIKILFTYISKIIVFVCVVIEICQQKIFINIFKRNYDGKINLKNAN